MNYLPDENAVFEIVSAALAEDIGTGDITTLSTIAPGAVITGRFVAKEDFVVCGLFVVRIAMRLCSKEIRFMPLAADGDRAAKGDVIATVSGPAAAILSAERVALNFLQRLSGISTYTAQCVAAVAGYHAKITDTRKTTPGIRVLEKYAVRTGGGSNHRFNLSDGVLIKDNHIAAAGGITGAVALAKAAVPHTVKIEVETENLAMVSEALDAGADIIMLDNMPLAEMAEAVSLIGGRALAEASGNMDKKDLAAVAATGVDIISIGALTHTVRAADISLKFDALQGGGAL